MRPLKLHTKTALLASFITITVMTIALLLFSNRILNTAREDQKTYAEIQAMSLAGQVNNLPSPRDYNRVKSAISVVRSSRTNIIAVRVWERSGSIFVERVTANSAAVEELSDETKSELRNNNLSRFEENNSKTGSTLFHVLVPIIEGDRVSGAVEVVEKLDNASELLGRFATSEILLSLLAIFLMLAALYLLFRHLIYVPLDGLLFAMNQAKAGQLDVKAFVKSNDEIGQLTTVFNKMIDRLNTMTKERLAQQDVLRERVKEATTELQLRNDQLEETNVELWRTSRRLTELERLAAAGQTAAQFAHEVGTPLNLISGHVQLLQLSLKDNPSAERLQIISSQIERIENIVRQMLDRTRFDSVEMQQLNLNSLLQRIFETTAPELEARNVRLHRTLNEELYFIKGNPDRLQQVFINLINNALDAMPDGGELTIATRKEKDEKNSYVAVDISDNGSGMSDEIKSHIFDPLYTTKKRGKGTGLGLVIAKQVMYEHNGEIEVESALGKGSRFRLRFPVSDRENQ